MIVLSNIQIYTAYLFARHQPTLDGGSFSKIFGKIYYCKIYDSNILKRDFIPCYSTTSVINVDGNSVPTNTRGLYDLVEGKFYTNQGRGEDFIAGPDV